MNLGNITKKKLKAYSLIEIVIYLGLFGLIFTTLISFFLAINEYNRNDQYQITTERTAIFVTEHLDETFRTAKNIVVGSSHFGTDIGDLTITRKDNSTIKYSVSGNRIIALTASPNFLSGTDFTINKFRFDQIIDNGVTIGVKFELMLTSAKNSRATKDIITTYIIE